VLLLLLLSSSLSLTVSLSYVSLSSSSLSDSVVVSSSAQEEMNTCGDAVWYIISGTTAEASFTLGGCWCADIFISFCCFSCFCF